jgi:hypothetical protein
LFGGLTKCEGESKMKKGYAKKTTTVKKPATKKATKKK